MSTAAELVQSITEDAGVDTTAGTADRVKALSCLNRAYREVIGQFRTIKAAATLTLTANTDLDLTLANWTGYTGSTDFTGSVSSRIAGLDAVGLDTSLSDTTTLPDSLLERKPYTWVLKARGEASTGDPRYYAFESGTLHLDRAASTTRLILFTYLSAPTLTEASAESAIDGIDPGWQERLLLPLATAILLEGWEGEEERAAYFRRLAESARSDFAREVVRKGGNTLPGWSVSDFRTPTPLTSR